MDETITLTIRNIDKEIAKRLVTVAKKKGYSGRDEMLREMLRLIAYDEFHLETELRYKAFTMEAIETMQQGMELLVREFFLPALEMTKRGAKIDE
ncbi:hypothetical protein FOV01_13815 (plasmid) [Enterococcus faecalis]|uniref:hypothetical protein n=1 Tax=Enterococcus faecalis TaxID=1351 RepID=UPI0011856F11|nr:hypothetical protein [Enterococcus faecalis]QDR53717.1 hypothetical protein FOV01_13815 [Enterococcus faecalis]